MEGSETGCGRVWTGVRMEDGGERDGVWTGVDGGEDGETGCGRVWTGGEDGRWRARRGVDGCGRGVRMEDGERDGVWTGVDGGEDGRWRGARRGVDGCGRG